jgi:hypothetical protein
MVSIVQTMERSCEILTEPTPCRQSKMSLHTIENTCGDETRKCARDQRSRVEHSRAERELLACVPRGQEEETTSLIFVSIVTEFRLRGSRLTEIGSLNEAQHETYRYKPSEALNSGSTC